MNKQEIQQKYLAQHDTLGTRKDAEDKELFDQQHGQVWADCDVELLARKSELKSKGELSAEESSELNELTSIFPEPAPPSRDLAKEIDDLKARVEKLEKK